MDDSLALSGKKRTYQRHQLRCRDAPYHPTPAQLRLLDAYGREDVGITIGELCQAAGCHRSTYYQMRDNPDAWGWWLRETERIANAVRPQIYAALSRRAQSGDVAALQVWLKRFDAHYIERAEHRVSWGGDWQDRQEEAEAGLVGLEDFRDGGGAERMERGAISGGAEGEGGEGGESGERAEAGGEGEK